ncbi:MAG: copper chaperone PCu(A)C [Nitratireductor sp.]
MNNKFVGIMLATLLTLASAIAALGEEIKIGNLEIINPHARATAPGAPVSGGYMVIRNKGGEPDRLVAASVDFAGKTEIHQMAMNGDVMVMRPVAGGLEIPAGGEVELKPGGYHIMFMKLGEQLKEGEMRKVMLTFEKAGEIEVEFMVEKVEAMKTMDHQKSGG